jgi:indolepyruvate ferredoxin oxidoreductase
MKIDPRFTQESGSAIFTGNELLVKGALETTDGVHLMTGYPGSPVAGFFDTLESIGPLLKDNGVVAKIASNEALSAAMVNGVQMVGGRAITAFKNVGLHVASDALALGTLAGTHDGSGGLIVVGDDPWSDSTQVPADSRFMAEHLRLPIMEPGNPQEVKDWIDLAFQIGRAAGIYIGYMMTVSTADGGGTVQCRPNHFPEFNEKQKQALSYEKDIEPTLEQSVLLPPRSWKREMQMEGQFAKVKDEARRLGVNRIVNAPQKDERVSLGFVASGNGYSYLRHALSEMGLTGQFPILKLGMPYPVDDKLTIELAKQCDKLIVVEERRSFVEKQILELLNPLRQSGQIQTEVYGKRFPKPLRGIPDTRGLNPSVVMERLIPLVQEHASLPAALTNGRLSTELERINKTGQFDVKLPERTPTFCPGCPHRDSSSVLLELRKDLLDPEYMLRHHKRKPVDLVAHGDTGCYTMLMFEPNKPLMHNYSGMGLGGATGAGADPFIDNKQLVFMGDGTFYHSGQTSIAHSIYNGQDITYIILDNKTTAMTGHQTHAGLEQGLTGEPLNALEIERIVRGTVPKHLEKDVRIVRMNPEDRDRYRQMMEQTILADGVKIVIADKECAITYHRRVKREERQTVKEKGYLPKKRYMNVATEVCEFCLECTSQTGCPGLKIEDTDYGPKIQTDMSWCVNDGACQRINACPSFEEVTVQRKQAPRMGDEHVQLDDLPEPPRPIHADQQTWRCYLAGVGGMGIGLCTAIMCTAGHEMGYHVQFLDKKGLAIRNGGVFSQLVFTRRDSNDKANDTLLKSAANGKPANGSQAGYDHQPPTTPLIPYGKADLLLGVDMLEATRALDPQRQYRVASPEHTAAVVNTAKTPTVLTLMGQDDFEIGDLEQTLKTYTDANRYVGFNVGDLCERVLDTKLYANIMMLGIAFQNGYLPLTQQAIEKAIEKVTRGQGDRNKRAFNIGRKIAVKPDLFVVEYQKDVESARKCLRRKLNTIRAWYGGKKGQRLARQFRVLMKQTFRATRGMRVDDELMRDVIIRAYDCLIWGGINYARRYCFRLVDIFHKDKAEEDYAITRHVVWRLAQCMLIKDEVYVAAMLTSPEKYKRDRRRFNVNGANGDKIRYKHHNRPEFEIFGKKIQFEWKSRDWQLRLMARARFLRKLMPGWHNKERAFRDWFEQIVDQIDVQNRRDYQRWLAVVRTIENVTGFREIRYPKMERARKEVDRLLSMDASEFELPEEREQREQQEKKGEIRLPILEGANA